MVFLMGIDTLFTVFLFAKSTPFLLGCITRIGHRVFSYCDVFLCMKWNIDCINRTCFFSYVWSSHPCHKMRSKPQYNLSDINKWKSHSCPPPRAQCQDAACAPPSVRASRHRGLTGRFICAGPVLLLRPGTVTGPKI